MLCRKVRPTPFLNKFLEVIMSRQWDYLVRLARSYPDEVQKQFSSTIEKRKTRLHALHLICCRDPTTEAVKTIISCFPEAAQTTDNYFNRLPLHFACIYEANVEVVRLVLRTYPDAVHMVALNGRLPLHYAAACHASPKTIRLLVESYGLAVRVADRQGMLPVHLAILQNASVEVVATLLRAFPGSVYVKTLKGNTPMNCLDVLEQESQHRSALKSLLEETENSISLHQAALDLPAQGGKENQFQKYTNMVNPIEIGEFC